MSIAFISHDDCQLHDMGPHHPECPARLTTINDRLIAGGLDMVLHRYDAPLASVEDLERVHDPEYVAQILRASPREGFVWLDADTALNPHSVKAALRAAGAVLMAVDLVLGDQAKQAFCAVRPPGHHAERRRAMGFCLFNNVAVGAYHALERWGLQRVAIVDFDVHHGNGTEDIVSGDSRLLFCSTFQHPFYPGSGFDGSAANVVNTPLAAGAGGAEFRAAVSCDWLPRLSAFAPQLIMLSAGFDAHRADDMAGLNLIDADYAWVTAALLEQARATAQGRLVSVLEGGYALPSLGVTVESHLKALLG